MRFTKAKTKREAVVRILEEFNRRRRMAELVKYSGSFSDTFPTNDEIEAVDAAREEAQWPFSSIARCGSISFGRVATPLNVIASMRCSKTGRRWCPAVRLELWRGVTNDAERKTLRRYEALLPDYEISDDVWERAIRLADRGRASGVTAPLADLLIFACAKSPPARCRARRRAF